MEAWLEWARGPAFVFAFSFMVLGLVRHAALTFTAMYKHLRRAGDPSLAYSKLTRATLEWMVPVGKIRTEVFYSATSVVFHIAILIVPVFLGGHIALWARGLGISWPAIPHDVADVLTIEVPVEIPGLRVAPAHRRSVRYRLPSDAPGEQPLFLRGSSLGSRDERECHFHPDADDEAESRGSAAECPIRLGDRLEMAR
jgi:hypothetical protein